MFGADKGVGTSGCNRPVLPGRRSRKGKIKHPPSPVALAVRSSSDRGQGSKVSKNFGLQSRLNRSDKTRLNVTFDAIENTH
jgi:hypothetical protein